MYEKDPIIQDPAMAILKGRLPTEDAIFARYPCTQCKQPEPQVRNNSNSEPCRPCCATNYPQNAVCCGNERRNWNWSNRIYRNQYPYSNICYQNYVNKYPAQYCCCASCQSRRKAAEGNNCCNAAENTIRCPCCNGIYVKSSDNKQICKCKDVETQYNVTDSFHSNIDGTGDSEPPNKDTERTLRESSLSKTEWSRRCESPSILSKPEDKRKSSFSLKFNKTESLNAKMEQNVSETSKPKLTPQSKSQGKLREKSFSINDEKYTDKSRIQTNSLRGSQNRNSAVREQVKIPKSANNINEYYNSKDNSLSTRSAFSDKKLKSTSNNRRVSELKNEKIEKPRKRENSIDSNRENSFRRISNYSKGMNKNEPSFRRNTKDITNATNYNKSKINKEKYSKPTQDNQIIDVERTYSITDSNSNDSEQSYVMYVNKKRSFKSESHDPEMAKTEEINSKISDDLISVDVNKSYVIYPNKDVDREINSKTVSIDLSKPGIKQKVQTKTKETVNKCISNDLCCDCCYCKYRNNTSYITKTMHKTEEKKDVAVLPNEDENPSIICLCSTSSSSNHESGHNFYSALNQKQRKSKRQNEPIEQVLKPELTEKNRISTLMVDLNQSSSTDSGEDKERPSIKNERSSINKERSSINKERSSINKERSSIDKERPSVDKERSSINKERSSVNKERPSIDKERPSMDKERSSINKERSSVNKERFSVSKERPSIDKERPCIGTERSSMNKERSSVNKERPSIDKERASINKQRPSTDKETPRRDKENTRISSQGPVQTDNQLEEYVWNQCNDFSENSNKTTCVCPCCGTKLDGILEFKPHSSITPNTPTSSTENNVVDINENVQRDAKSMEENNDDEYRESYIINNKINDGDINEIHPKRQKKTQFFCKKFVSSGKKKDDKLSKNDKLNENLVEKDTATVSRSTEVEMGQDTFQRARQKSKNNNLDTCICDKDIEKIGSACSC